MMMICVDDDAVTALLRLLSLGYWLLQPPSTATD
jgi:hypothetical protein